MSDFHQLPTSDSQPSSAWNDLNMAAETRAKNASTAQMPSLEHLTLDDYEHVYEPAADTFLLIDALKYEIERGVFDSHKSPLIVLEIGCGSGVPSIFFRQEWNRQHATELAEPCRVVSLATDINPMALEVTIRTARANVLPVDDCFEVIQCDLASPLLDRLHGMVDVILFNPPYVPTLDHEVGTNGIEASWAGGVDGRLVIDRALPQIATLVSSTGRVYMITVDDNRPEQIANTLFEFHGLKCTPLFRRRTRNERLTVQLISSRVDE